MLFDFKLCIIINYDSDFDVINFIKDNLND